MIQLWLFDVTKKIQRRITMRQKKLLMLLGSIVILALLVLPAPAPASEKPIVLNLTHMWPSISAQHEHIMGLAEKVKTGSNNRLIIKVFSDSSLMKPVDTWDGLAKGLADMAMGWRYEPGRKILMHLPAFTYDIGHAKVASQLSYDLYDNLPEYRAEWKANKILYFAGAGPSSIHTTKKQILTLDDLKGQQIRAPLPEVAKNLTALGAVPVTIPVQDAFMALQKGTIDGSVGADEQLKSFRHAHVTKYTCEIPGMHGSTGFYVGINWNTYNSLPPDLQKVLEDASAWAKEDAMNMWANQDDLGREYAMTLGHKFNFLLPGEDAKFIASYEIVAKEYAQKMDAEGLPGTRLLQYVRQRIEELKKTFQIKPPVLK
jgi:TRAP-type C4-dicarboxylate transport system substrate-binding protein